MKKYCSPLALLMFFFFSTSVSSASNKPDELEEDVKIGTTVIGNAEFPKVEYQHPWKRIQINTDAVNSVQKNKKAVIDLRFIDKKTLQRKLSLYKHIQMTRRNK